MKKQTKKSKLNVRLLRRIQKFILEEPRRFLMSTYSIRVGSQTEWEDKTVCYCDASDQMPPCGTAACIAGTANLLSGSKRLYAPRKAHRILGLPFKCDFMNHPLFFVGDWPEKFVNRYNNATTPAKRARVACQRIDHLIQHGE